MRFYIEVSMCLFFHFSGGIGVWAIFSTDIFMWELVCWLFCISKCMPKKRTLIKTVSTEVYRVFYYICEQKNHWIKSLNKICAIEYILILIVGLNSLQLVNFIMFEVPILFWFSLISIRVFVIVEGSIPWMNRYCNHNTNWRWNSSMYIQIMFL